MRAGKGGKLALENSLFSHSSLILRLTLIIRRLQSCYHRLLARVLSSKFDDRTASLLGSTLNTGCFPVMKRRHLFTGWIFRSTKDSWPDVVHPDFRKRRWRPFGFALVSCSWAIITKGLPLAARGQISHLRCDDVLKWKTLNYPLIYPCSLLALRHIVALPLNTSRSLKLDVT